MLRYRVAGGRERDYVEKENESGWRKMYKLDVQRERELLHILLVT